MYYPPHGWDPQLVLYFKPVVLTQIAFGFPGNKETRESVRPRMPSTRVMSYRYGDVPLPL